MFYFYGRAPLKVPCMYKSLGYVLFAIYRSFELRKLSFVLP